MDNSLGPDLLSDLPLSIIESILSLLPIRDAVRTSVLSTKWRYRWASVPQLVFDERCITYSPDKTVVEDRLIKFVTHSLLLHKGPIHKFKLCSSILQNCPDIDQWVLFLARNDIRELTLELGEGEWLFRVPSCLFSCKKLTHLELCRCELDPPPSFRGFFRLRTLNLQQVFVAPEVIENLISSSPLLENLTLYYDCLELSINAPNLKYLCVEGEFREICLENTPLLEVISITLYMNADDVQDLSEQNSGCNFVNFLGGVPNLERLVGHVYFTKYLSIGIELWKPSLTYNHLKVIELYQVSFEDIKEILVILRLIMNSPNLQELHISGSPSTKAALERSDLDIWKTECPSDCTFKKLKTVKITEMCGVPQEMELVKLLLGYSPSLEKMSITPCATEGRMDMLVELVRFRRASPLAEILFIKEQAL